MSSKQLLPIILLHWASACLAQMGDPKPSGTGRPYYQMHMLNESKPVAGTLMSCGSHVTVKEGDQYEIRNTPNSCWYYLSVESGVPVTIKCPTFMLQCDDYNFFRLWITVINDFENVDRKYCLPNQAPTGMSVPAKNSEHLIVLSYYIGGTESRDMICTVTGGSRDSGDDEGDCGRSSAESTGRIIDGGYAAVGEYPWMVHITSSVKACGATIINKQWLLTAAHCVKDPSTGEQITACIGSNNIKSCKKVIKSTKIIAHSGYTYSDIIKVQPDDIALAKLAEPLVFDDTIRPVCLPASISDKLATGSDIEIAGWGYAKRWSIRISNEMKKAWTKVIEPQHCTKAKYYHIVCLNPDRSNKFPSGYSCFGDTGGYGGAKNAQGRAVQYGVSSSYFYLGSVGCLEPSAYTDVADYVDWIKLQMEFN